MSDHPAEGGSPHRDAEGMGLHAAIAARLREPGRPRDAELDELTLATYRWQRASNPLLAAMFGDADPVRVDAIPAVPVALFKDLDLGPSPPLATDRTFRTSGTTGQVRGVHRMRDTRLYDLGSAAWFEHRLRALPGRVVSLCPTGTDSSLGQMVSNFAARASSELRCLFSAEGVAPGAWEAIREPGPLFLATTAFALDALFAMPGEAALDSASLVMVTGGFKGRAVRLDAPSLYREIGARLGKPRVVGEYGMTELCSQLWTDPVSAGGVPAEFVAPPWLRAWTVDPFNAQPAPAGGLLRFCDLANLDSVLCIETQDLGVVEERAEGDRVRLVGRVDGAELRGCSLRAEAFARAVG